MESAKLSYAGIAGAVAGVLGLLGAVSKWYAVSLAGGTLTVKGTSDASGKLALAMSVALFAFSAAYVLIADARIRRSMAALMIVTAVVLTLAAVWGLTRADGASVEMGPVAHRFGRGARHRRRCADVEGRSGRRRHRGARARQRRSHVLVTEPRDGGADGR